LSAPGRPYRLTDEPGGLGLNCTDTGLSLAGVPLLRTTPLGFEPRSAAEIGALANRAYGDDIDPTRLASGLEVVAQALNRGDLGRAMIAAVQLRLPELDWGAAVRIAQAEHALAKFDPNEPRDGRGRWTTGAGAAPAPSDPAPQPSRDEPARDDPRSGGVQSRPDRQSEPEPAPLREVRPETLTPVAAEEEEPRSFSNRPPGIVDDLREIFPWLPETRADAILAPIDGLLGLSEPGEAANEAATQIMRDYLIAQIKAINPKYVFESFDPGGMPSTWKGRTNLIDGLLAERAAALYRFRGETGPLQVETLRFVQHQVDEAYAEAVKLLSTGGISGLSSQQAIGSEIDRTVRERLRRFYNSLNISPETDAQVRVNSREYDTSEGGRTYRLPDSRVGDIAFEVSLTPKAPGIAQVRGFFNADFKPSAVVIIRPSQLGPGSTYLITRPVARSPRI